MHPTHRASTDAVDESARSGLLVVGFCAAWCNTCADFHSAFDDLAVRRPEARFVWLDIEDDAAIVGDIDIENFPTLAIFGHDRLLHFGVSLPQAPIVARLLDSLGATSLAIVADDAITSLPARLRSAGLASVARRV
jgi:thioredoxin reductase (NADPH)